MTQPVKLIAFYLPQFHPIPENDRWWGKGFTEWTNVTRARPLFPGHHQPHLPADLGFYDLRLPEAREEQAALARDYGIHGFCYYHYWFNGKHLLERPFNEVLASGKPDFPFCLCWANENWTRRWDGAEQEVLLGQNYNDDDDREHILWLINAFRDPRYIRVDGKPLILIYRARHLPNPKRTLATWRREAIRAGVGDLYICRVENFANERDDPHELGFDASVDFQPDWMALPSDHPQVELPDGHVVVDYRELVQAQLARPAPRHKRFAGVTPGWDNSARRKKKAFIIEGSTPAAYGYWLEEVVRKTLEQPAEERLVFVNAWNEWAEGNHLEPDQKFGRAYLDATRQALTDAVQPRELQPSPLTQPLTFDGYVSRAYYQDWLKSRSIGKIEAPQFDRLFSERGAPRVSILLDATSTDETTLSATLQSVAGQQYPNWHLTVFATTAAPSGLQSAKVTWATIAPGAFPACVDSAAEAHAKDWHVTLLSGETLAPHAILMVAAAIASDPDLALVVTDGEWLNEDGQAIMPMPMSGINRQRLWSDPTWPGLVACRGELLRVGMADAAVTSPDLLRAAVMLRALELAKPRQLRHCQFIALRSTQDPAAKGTIQERAALVGAHLARTGIPAAVLPGLTFGSLRIHPAFTDNRPRSVAIILLHCEELDAVRQCIETVLANTTDLPFSLRIPLPANAEPDYRAFLQGVAEFALPNLQVIECSGSCRPEIANQLTLGTTADVLVFLDPHCLPLANDWLDILVRQACLNSTGIVGPRLVDRKGAIHTGFVRLGLGGVASSAYVGITANAPGVGGELTIAQNVSAVSGKCMAIRREVFARLDGFRPARYGDQHADIDLCLRAAQLGHDVVWTPFATMLCTLPADALDADRPASPADDALLEDWLPQIAVDSHFNRQLSRSHQEPTLEPDLSLSWDPLPWRPLPRIYAHPADLSGSGEIRVRAPMKHLRASGRAQLGGGYRQLHISEMAALAPDSIILQRPFTDVGLRYVRGLRKHLNSFLVYELDDLITRIPKENANRSGFPTDIEARVAEGMRACNRLVVSTEPLADAYRRYCADVRVVPNYLDGSVWKDLTPMRRTGSRPRVGWAGSSSHGGDLALLEECVRKTSGDLDWIFLGHCPPAIAQFAAEVHSPVSIAEYPLALAGLGLDLAVAPLAANAFNDAKSNLKILEYGILGYPVICSNITPYQGSLAVTRIGNRPQDWISAIRAQANDLDAARRNGEILREQVRADWLIEGHLDEWLAAWLPESAIPD